MKPSSKLSPKVIKLDAEERYIRLFSTKSGNALSLSAGRVLLKEKENIGEHSTGDSEEILVVLEGNGELRVNKSEILEFEKDTAIYIPPNTIHDVKNAGRGLLKYVFVKSQ